MEEEKEDNKSIEEKIDELYFQHTRLKKEYERKTNSIDKEILQLNSTIIRRECK